MLRLQHLILAVVAAAAVALLPSSPSAAYSCGQAGNWHVGQATDRSHTSRNDLYGAYARIDIRQALQCAGGSNKFSNVYSMVLDHNYAFWAQSGFEKDPVNGIRHFAQIRNNVNLYTWYGGTIAAGGDADYKSYIAQVPSGSIGSFVNGSVKVSAADSGWASPYEIEYSGESRYRESDIPGVSSNRVKVSLMKLYSSNSWAWQDTPCGIFGTYNQAPSRWQRATISCTQFNLWTDPTN